MTKQQISKESYKVDTLTIVTLSPL